MRIEITTQGGDTIKLIDCPHPAVVASLTTLPRGSDDTWVNMDVEAAEALMWELSAFITEWRGGQRDRS